MIATRSSSVPQVSDQNTREIYPDFTGLTFPPVVPPLELAQEPSPDSILGPETEPLPLLGNDQLLQYLNRPAVLVFQNGGEFRSLGITLSSVTPNGESVQLDGERFEISPGTEAKARWRTTGVAGENPVIENLPEGAFTVDGGAIGEWRLVGSHPLELSTPVEESIQQLNPTQFQQAQVLIIYQIGNRYEIEQLSVRGVGKVNDRANFMNAFVNPLPEDQVESTRQYVADLLGADISDVDTSTRNGGTMDVFQPDEMILQNSGRGPSLQVIGVIPY